jgi:hypothetical protein
MVTAFAAPANAIVDHDGSAVSLQGKGGTNHVGTQGKDSPAYNLGDNLNVCLPRVDHVAVGLLAAVNLEVPIADQQNEQICNVGQTMQTDGDATLSHLIG